MHIFLSDLHLTDWDLGNPVSDVELTAFCNRELTPLCDGGKTELILLGDVVDLLRSAKWAELWEKHKGAPWRAQGPGFENFVGDFGEQYAVEVAKGIVGKYTGFSQSLKDLVGAKKLTISFVIGNHDYMAQLSPKIRQIPCEFLSVAHDPAKPFPGVYANEATSIYATHGHCFDRLNWHRQAEGHWALGDAVVLRIVNRFATEACRSLGISEISRMGRRFHEIDNIEPLIDLPVYVRWLTDEFLTIRKETSLLSRIHG